LGHLIKNLASPIVGGALGVIIAAATLPAAAEEPILPQYQSDIRLGVASCAGSTCHGAVEPWKGSNVLQNEYATWQRSDKHAKAYEVLLNDKSKRIAKNLGLKNAHTAAVCLDCHADNVPAKLRAKQFQISDGVGCEACHGSAMRWLGIHVSGAATRKEEVAAGMYPTEDPINRARLCLSCHFGDGKKFVTHRIMGAGHPRLSFELDTFTAIQPAHYKIDKDYNERKQVANGVKTWAIGQAIAIDQLLEAMLDPKRGREGIFPELVFFDCQACHHPMSNIRWAPRASTGLGPGLPRFNDANLVMLRIIAKRIDADAGETLRQQTLALHKASTQSYEVMLEAAKALRETVRGLIQSFAKHKFDTEIMRALLNGVVEEGLIGEYADYAAAEQATMALGAITTAMKAAGAVNEKQHKAMTKALDASYQAVAKDEQYQPKAFVAALRKFKASMPK